MIATTDHLADAALSLAKQGFRVFPLHGIRSRAEDDVRLACTCGNATCPSPGKHGALRGKSIVDTASTDPATVKRWWSTPGRNIAIVTGKVAGLLVVDVDVGGQRALDALEARHGPLPVTLEARTGTGGRHLYFRHPPTGSFPSSENRFGARISAIGEGGYTVAPPSLHASGDPYQWVDASVPPADLPAWLVAAWAPEPTIEIPAIVDDPREFLADIDAFAVCRGGANGDDVIPALSALASALAQGEVDPDSIRHRLRDLNKNRCRPALPAETVDDIAFNAIAEDKRRRDDERRAREKLPKVVADGSTAAEQKLLATMRDRDRRARAQNPARTALDAWINTYWAVLDYDEPRAELRLVWLETGQVVEVPTIGTAADMERRIIRYVGSLDLWAHQAHPEANGKLLVSLIKNRVKRADARKREDADGAPVQLVRTLLASSVWYEFTEGNERRRWKRSLLTVEGFFPDDGVGRIRVKGQELLVVHFAMLANGALRGHSEFRGLKESQLKALFLAAPGANPKAVRPREARRHMDTDFWAIDLEIFRAATEKSGPGDVIEIDSPRSPDDRNSHESPRETHENVGETPLPHDSPGPTP